MNLHEDRENFEQYLMATAAHMNLPDIGIVEKDYFVTLFLKKITEIIPGVIFKGGTSLCLIFGASQISYAAIPSYGFGRGQQAVHFNPQSVGNSTTVGTVNGIPPNVHNLYNYGDHIGVLTVERLGRTVKVYGGATMRNMDFDAAHFSFTGLNVGNTSLV